MDGQRLAAVRLDSDKPGEFFYQTYPIPTRITRGKEEVVVRFQAHPEKTAGGVFGCTVLTRCVSDRSDAAP